MAGLGEIGSDEIKKADSSASLRNDNAGRRAVQAKGYGYAGFSMHAICRVPVHADDTFGEWRENGGMNYLWLAGAILSEVIATSSLKASNGFTKLLPSLAVVIGYGAAFYFLSQT